MLWLGVLALLAAVALGAGYEAGQAPLGIAPMAGLLVALLAGIWVGATQGMRRAVVLAVMAAALGLGGLALTAQAGNDALTLAVTLGYWLGAWALVAQIAALPRTAGLAGRMQALIAPLVFGLTLIWVWQVAVTALSVPRVILPAPSEIAVRLASSTDTLWIDLVQTFVRGTLSGYVIGCSAAVLFALVVDKVDFLRRGLLPVGNFLAALPIIGTAPIFVMWFGFDWPSKAAVVVAMVFFPMLVNTVQGLAATDKMQRDLMHTYSAGWWQTLTSLRLPAAMPFVFNGLKICATLALIGSIVAEFFGSPTRGMGFRISTEVGRLQLDMVWAEIAVAALLGSAFYGFWALLERRVTFWHPSQRGR